VKGKLANVVGSQFLSEPSQPCCIQFIRIGTVSQTQVVNILFYLQSVA